MQISSVPDSFPVSTLSNASATRTAASSLNTPPSSVSADLPTVTIKSKPEDYLTDGDVNMILYVSGTSSLEKAELNPNAKNLAQSLGWQRENGYVQGDVSKGYWYSQLTGTDAKLIEGMTGTSNILDAINSGDAGVTQLASNVAFDRIYGSLNSDVSVHYLQDVQSNEESAIANATHMGQPIANFVPFVPIEALQRAMTYISDHAISHAGIKLKRDL